MIGGQRSTTSSTRGRGRGRGRGRPRGSGRGGERDSARFDRVEDDPGTSPQHNIESLPHDSKLPEEASDVRAEKETLTVANSNRSGIVHNFDLNLDLDDNGNASAATSTAASEPALEPVSASHHEMKDEGYAGWPLSEMDRMAMDPVKLSILNNRIEEEEEDYDNDDG